MPDVYKDFQREPSRAHQCMHESEKDGTRCRAMSMANNYMCYAHRTDDVVTVIETTCSSSTTSALTKPSRNLSATSPPVWPATTSI